MGIILEIPGHSRTFKDRGNHDKHGLALKLISYTRLENKWLIS